MQKDYSKLEKDVEKAAENAKDLWLALESFSVRLRILATKMEKEKVLSNEEIEQAQAEGRIRAKF